MYPPPMPIVPKIDYETAKQAHNLLDRLDKFLLLKEPAKIQICERYWPIANTIVVLFATKSLLIHVQTKHKCIIPTTLDIVGLI